MSEIITAIAVIIAIGAVIAAFVIRGRTKRIIKNINEMIDSAIDGSFSEKHFDESVMSAMESRLRHYISSSETSALRVAEEKDKIKTLIADISHQTKTPTANIRLYSELLHEQNLSQDALLYADSISAQSEKLSFLISSLVKLSRLETGIITLNPQKSEILPMLKELFEQYAPKAAAKGLSFTIAEECGSAVFDPKWTTEAIGNIIDNAIKYTESGSVTISAKAYEMFTCVCITDTGMGITEDEHAKIFSRFYRSAQANGCEGVGIGLYLAREIISGEGGYIKVSSQIGKGAVFSVFLPNKMK